MFDFLIEYWYSIMYNVLYYCTYIYNIIVQFYKSNKYKLGYIQLHKSYNEYNEYNEYDKYDKQNTDYKFIKIKYSYNDNQYFLMINDSILNINKYYPPYDPYLLEDVNLDIKKILTATIIYKDNSEKDVSDIINKYAGPYNNFYKDIHNYKYPTIQDIWGEDVVQLNVLTNDIQEITITDKLII